MNEIYFCHLIEGLLSNLNIPYQFFPVNILS